MDRQFMAAQTARMLLEVKAIQFNADKPYIFTSGWASPSTPTAASSSPSRACANASWASARR